MSQIITVINGDGIGPEIMRATLRALDALNCGFEYEFAEAGLAFSMPLMDKIDLAKAAPGWAMETKLKLFRELCGAVGFAHRNGVRHRDIKPENILVTAANAPVLTDFDISDLLFKRTMSAKAVGTMIYAAPEQLEQAGDATDAVDTYSLGRVLHFLLLDKDPSLGLESRTGRRDRHNNSRRAFPRVVPSGDPRRRRLRRRFSIHLQTSTARSPVPRPHFDGL